MEGKPRVKAVAESFAGLGSLLENADESKLSALMEKDSLTLKEKIEVAKAQAALYEKHAIQLAGDPENAEAMATALEMRKYSESALEIKKDLEMQLMEQQRDTAERLPNDLKEETPEEDIAVEPQDEVSEAQTVSQEKESGNEITISDIENAKTFEETASLISEMIEQSDTEATDEVKELADFYKRLAENNISTVGMLNGASKETLHDITTKFSRYIVNDTFEAKNDRGIIRMRKQINELFDENITDKRKAVVREAVIKQLNYFKAKKMEQEESGETLVFNDLSREELNERFAEQKKHPLKTLMFQDQKIRILHLLCPITGQIL